MPAGRILAALTASLAVGGCAVVVFGMTTAASEPDASSPVTVRAVPTARPAFVPVDDGRTSPASAALRTSAAAASTTVAAPVPTVAASTAVRPTSAAPRVAPTSRPAAVLRPAARSTTRTATSRPAPARSAATRAAPVVRAAPKATGARLPLGYSTGSATRVITVTAGSHGSTVATLQAWTKVTGGWKRYGSAVTAHVGAQGIGRASETTSHTPVGSFTLTQAFGRRSDPGTALPYFRTTTSDYWISDAGKLYNTHQRCGSCGYDDGVNERLYYETPYYNYAVVIDYNTRNAPGGVHKGRGSAFFLHVTDGRPTAGCVAIPQSRLVPLMTWLRPSAHPRILIGVV